MRSRPPRGYARYRHGEAVGLGLLAALTLSAQPALRDEVAELLAARGLPTQLDPAIDPADVVAATARDKKRRDGLVGFVLVEAPGDVRTGMRGRARRPARRSGRVGAVMRNRVAVLHGVNLDALDRRPAEHYGGLTLRPARAADRRLRARARARGALLPDELRGRVRRGAPQGRRLRRRAAAQPGRVDALRVGDPRRARGRPGCPPSRSTCPTSRPARSSAACR